MTTVIHRLEPPIELDTPRGRADAYFLLDYGSEDSLVWITFLRGSGECWSFRNPFVRKTFNETMGTGNVNGKKSETSERFCMFRTDYRAVTRSGLCEKCGAGMDQPCKYAKSET